MKFRRVPQKVNGRTYSWVLWATEYTAKDDGVTSPGLGVLGWLGLYFWGSIQIKPLRFVFCRPGFVFCFFPRRIPLAELRAEKAPVPAALPGSPYSQQGESSALRRTWLAPGSNLEGHGFPMPGSVFFFCQLIQFEQPVGYGTSFGSRWYL